MCGHFWNVFNSSKAVRDQTFSYLAFNMFLYIFALLYSQIAEVVILERTLDLMVWQRILYTLSISSAIFLVNKVNLRETKMIGVVSAILVY